MKEKIMQVKNVDELMDVESAFFNEYRNSIYNELLKDDKIKKHLCGIFGVSENALQNALMINGYPPIDDFDEEK